MVNANLNGHNAELYLVNMETGEMTYWKDISVISDDDLECSVDSEEISLENLISGEEIAFSIELSPTLNELTDELVEKKSKPNPIYVPKHIARRRKW